MDMDFNKFEFEDGLDDQSELLKDSSDPIGVNGPKEVDISIQA